ncbi:hypothetical protein C8F01DRAFT_1329904 [Mycena amicta]|nr:hypothetical protein C8F01DRAFT_1329904 [Mycena amicta]
MTISMTWSRVGFATALVGCGNKRMSRKKWHENLKASIRGLLWEEIDVIDGIGGARVTLGLLSSSEVREKGSWALTISAVDIGVRRARIAGDAVRRRCSQAARKSPHAALWPHRKQRERPKSFCSVPVTVQTSGLVPKQNATHLSDIIRQIASDSLRSAGEPPYTKFPPRCAWNNETGIRAGSGTAINKQPIVEQLNAQRFRGTRRLVLELKACFCFSSGKLRTSLSALAPETLCSTTYENTRVEGYLPVAKG